MAVRHQNVAEQFKFDSFAIRQKRASAVASCAQIVQLCASVDDVCHAPYAAQIGGSCACPCSHGSPSVITERGRRVLSTHPERVDNKVLEQFPEFLEFKSRRSEKGEPVGTHGEPQAPSVASLSPTEAITRLVSDADDAVAAELLDRVLAQPPAFLERLSLRLLQAMGYGGKEALLTHTGKPGDAGLDGIVRQDALGLDLVGVQAKRYDRDSAVQRPEMQAFVGALQGAQTSRGVFVTTGRFSSGARLFAEQVPIRLVLIDGTELTRLMVRYDVGVSVKETYQLKSVDDDFFDDSDL